MPGVQDSYSTDSSDLFLISLRIFYALKGVLHDMILSGIIAAPDSRRVSVVENEGLRSGSTKLCGRPDGARERRLRCEAASSRHGRPHSSSGRKLWPKWKTCTRGVVSGTAAPKQLHAKRPVRCASLDEVRGYVRNASKYVAHITHTIYI